MALEASLLSQKKFLETVHEYLLSQKKIHEGTAGYRDALKADLVPEKMFAAVAELAIASKDFREGFYTLPFPPLKETPGIGYASDQPNLIAYTVRLGLSNMRLLDRVWKKYRDPGDTYRILDFGCGTGRLLRYPCQFGEGIEIEACDVNPKAVEWISNNFPCKVHQISETPGLPFLDKPFDVIYAWSIFTHFAEEVHKQWLEVLMGALRPGGLLLATFKSTAMIELLDSDPEYRKMTMLPGFEVPTEQLRKAAESGFAYHTVYEPKRAAEHGVNASTFGQAYISHDYIRAHWSEYGDVMGIETAIPNRTDVVALKARGR